VRKGNQRQPDILFVSHERVSREKFTEGADLIIEIVSPGAENRQRDPDDKRNDYASGGIPEYWLVDPETRTITVLMLSGEEYRVHGEFRTGATATSLVVPQFTVDVAACFAAADSEAPPAESHDQKRS
jgi:Uma2 family endonuclease